MEEKSSRRYRKFSEEFKKEALELASKVGNTQAGRDLGVSESQIRNWKSQLKLSSSPSNKKSYEQLEQELKKANRELYYMKEINKVLKKARPSYLKT